MEKTMLTAHFSLEEMTRSETAMKWRISNKPNAEQIAKLRSLCSHILEPLRVAAGRPLVINSGFRSAGVNQVVGGAKDSYHTKGQAADIAVKDYHEAAKLAIAAKKLPYLDLAIIESKGVTYWLHVQYRPISPRHKVFEILKP